MKSNGTYGQKLDFSKMSRSDNIHLPKALIFAFQIRLCVFLFLLVLCIETKQQQIARHTGETPLAVC